LYLHTPDPYTHKPTILHCDMKPSNILLDQDKRARLADMGLARAQRQAAAHLTAASSIAGTNGYLDGYYLTTGRFDEIADAYAVGVTLLVLLSGSAAVDPVRGHIIGRCNAEDVSEVADERAQWSKYPFMPSIEGAVVRCAAAGRCARPMLASRARLSRWRRVLLGFMSRCKIVAGGASGRAGAAAATRWNGTGAASTAEAAGAGAGRAGVAGTGREAEGLVPVPKLVREGAQEGGQLRMAPFDGLDDRRTAA
jgi:hypothetical protein